MDVDLVSRAQGCFLGQLAGDSLGSLVEFQTPDRIRRDYPGGVRRLADGGTWGTIAGQPTDTNAAITGALLGAVYGRNAIPDQWLQRLLNCRPLAGEPHVRRPRPECFWPIDALQLAERLVSQTKGNAS